MVPERYRMSASRIALIESYLDDDDMTEEQVSEWLEKGIVQTSAMKRGHDAHELLARQVTDPEEWAKIGILVKGNFRLPAASPGSGFEVWGHSNVLHPRARVKGKADVVDYGAGVIRDWKLVKNPSNESFTHSIQWRIYLALWPACTAFEYWTLKHQPIRETDMTNLVEVGWMRMEWYKNLHVDIYDRIQRCVETLDVLVSSGQLDPDKVAYKPGERVEENGNPFDFEQGG